LRRMEMTQSFCSFQSSQPGSPAPACGAATYTHPGDVTSDPKLTIAEKRAVLASWISDARAVENAPSLRRLDSGAVVEVDNIRRALVLLDELAPIGYPKHLPSSGRRHSVVSRRLRRVGPPNRSNNNDNDDDDPPPAPAGFGIPFRPRPLSPAQGARLEAPALCAAG
jgi:hypothetical protein